MGSLREQLVAAGFASEEALQRVEALDATRAINEQQGRQKSIEAKHASTLEGLEEIPTVREFRAKAQTLLEERPDLIEDVVRLAHRLKTAPGGKRLIWQVFQARDLIAGGDVDRQLLRRAMRAHRPTNAPVEE